MKTRYFLDETSGIKVPSSLSRKQIKYMSEFYLQQGMKEVSQEEYRAAKKKWREPEDA